MLKILYAASNNQNASIQLSRFIEASRNLSFKLKIAAYKKSYPYNSYVDWTLDSLINILNTENVSLDNDNYRIYYEQVIQYSPDLIISDLEYYTSTIAMDLDIPLWQCSSSFLNMGLYPKDKYSSGIFTNYSYLFNKNPSVNKRLINLIDNSNYNLVYSHFGDCNNPPLLKKNFNWVRPYHSVGKRSKPCRHNIVAITLEQNKSTLALLKKEDDCVIFNSGNILEQYDNIMIKDIKDTDEYFCNIYNSNHFINEGQTSFLADAFYNNKFSLVKLNHSDPESVLNSLLSEKIGLSKTITSFDSKNKLDFDVKDNNIPYLHEYIYNIL